MSLCTLFFQEKVQHDRVAGSQLQPLRFLVHGGLGTGKSFLTKWIQERAEEMGLQVACMALTGIAAGIIPQGTTCHHRRSRSVARRLVDGIYAYDFGEPPSDDVQYLRGDEGDLVDDEHGEGLLLKLVLEPRLGTAWNRTKIQRSSSKTTKARSHRMSWKPAGMPSRRRTTTPMLRQTSTPAARKRRPSRRRSITLTAGKRSYTTSLTRTPPRYSSWENPSEKISNVLRQVAAATPWPPPRFMTTATWTKRTHPLPPDSDQCKGGRPTQPSLSIPRTRSTTATTSRSGPSSEYRFSSTGRPNRLRPNRPTPPMNGVGPNLLSFSCSRSNWRSRMKSQSVVHVSGPGSVPPSSSQGRKTSSMYWEKARAAIILTPRHL
ncbi:hypothetical protein OUZ56_003473 [Daphnia magna]|uniref:ATP-dependent DNA helicase n=1 Tax=Daphnia magna TaxID=35525 RepID=A0ABR0A8T0_9CRUS|nr:hypothetical protein OUZ56_003473 [Daphnia magna]